MIGEAIDTAEGLSVVYLEVRSQNAPAIALYEKLGFERVGIRKDYYDRPRDHALIMKLDHVTEK